MEKQAEIFKILLSRGADLEMPGIRRRKPGFQNPSSRSYSIDRGYLPDPLSKPEIVVKEKFGQSKKYANQEIWHAMILAIQMHNGRAQAAR